MPILTTAGLAQSRYLQSKPKTARKALGQYFTESAIAKYMASMINPVKTPIVRILDAGAGTGILAIAAAMRCLSLGHSRIHIVLYEIDSDLLPHLDQNMRRMVRLFKKQDGKFTYEIRHEDFVLARPDKTEQPFHISSINPPYFKYNAKTSPYAQATADLYAGNPNIYASFMAIVAACLAPNGQMVAIVPRSFTNGLYFKHFRHYLNRTMSLEKIHIFRARNTVFKMLDVLQENIICHYTKCRQKTRMEIRASTGHDDLDRVKIKRYQAGLIIDSSNSHHIVRIPESTDDARILQLVEQWPANFNDSGYTISTGPVVEHRTRQYISAAHPKAGSVPLLRMHNVKAFKTEWTGHNKKDARFRLAEGHTKHTSTNQPLVILKRFSSKDEKRRLVAAVHDPASLKGKRIAFENHLNCISREDGTLDIVEAYGLAVLFNSTLMDKYFRCISGNTQVNATEIRLLKLPSRQIIRRLGSVFQKKPEPDQQHIDHILDLCLINNKNSQ